MLFIGLYGAKGMGSKGLRSGVDVLAEGPFYHCLPLWLFIANYHQIYQEGPYRVDSTASRLLREVKQRRARLVLRWGTTLESRVFFF